MESRGRSSSALAPGNPAPFDRLVSVSDIEEATCTFLVFTADLFGYVPTVVLMLWKTFSESGRVQSDEIVQQVVNALSIVVCIVVVCKNGQTACQACEPGFANDQEEANLCYSCSSGMYSSLHNQTSSSRFWSSRSDFRKHGATHRVSQNLSCRFLSWSPRKPRIFWRELDLMTFLIIVIPLSVLAHSDTVTVSLWLGKMWKTTQCSPADSDIETTASMTWPGCCWLQLLLTFLKGVTLYPVMGDGESLHERSDWGDQVDGVIHNLNSCPSILATNWRS